MNSVDADILRRVIALLQSGSKAQQAALRQSLDQIETPASPAPVKTRRAVQKPASVPLDQTALIDALRQATSMEAATQLLQGRKLRRADLAALARALDIPVRSKDKLADLVHKIANELVGVRLNSAAIRGQTRARPTSL